MKKMMKNRKGFTLMEMLIVVAIIAILVIIAIPTFNSALAKARAATDVANIRSGYAAAQVDAMTEGLKGKDGKDATTVTYILQQDGSVKKNDDTANAKPYKCVGSSKNAASGTTIGGRVEVNIEKTDSENGKIGWAKDATITYTVTETDGVFSVEIASNGTSGN